ncbi:(2Fe-2S)-binding protein [uncultured Croceitalea sp.]|uniref:(2Fe-2S)-binding protein n=1 Tax=uncultured Croceitalea sp. TaxID=1798908 RepID=UPI0033068E7D
MNTIFFKLNGKEVSTKSDANKPLLWVLRDEFNLMGTKYGCGIGQCGACTVHLNGNAVRSCLLPISQLQGEEITTIEGLSAKGDHVVQKAWKEVDVPQCGYCQAGQIMTASAFLKQNPDPTIDEINNAMHGNICRCAAYHRIRKAVMLAAKK